MNSLAKVFSGVGGWKWLLLVAIVSIASAQNTLVVTPQSLTFTTPANNQVPQDQALSITSTGVSADWRASTQGESWLTLVSGQGRTPGTLYVRINATGLATLSAGSYQGVIQIQSVELGTTVNVSVSLTVGAATTLSASPTALAFSGLAGGSSPAAQTITVQSSGPALTYQATASGGSWLSITSGSTGTTPGSVTVSVSPSTLSAGTYSGTITIAASGAANSPISVGVTFTVGASGTAVLVSSPTSVSFTAISGSTTTQQQSVVISASNGTSFAFSASASSGGWLSVSPTSAYTPSTIVLTANPTSLPAATYTGSVTVSSSSPASTLTIPVSLTVTSAGLTATPASLLFTSLDGTRPADQTIQVTSSTGVATSFTATASGGSWLSVTPTSAITGNTLTVSAVPTGLTTGNHTGKITLTPLGSTTGIEVPVTLSVGGATAIAVSPTSITLNAATGGNPSAIVMAVSSTSSALTFSLTASSCTGGYTWLTTDVASGITPANVSVGASSAALAAGSYTCNLIVTPMAGGNALTVPVTLVVGGTTSSYLSASPSSLSFTASVGGGIQGPQSVYVYSSLGSISYTAVAYSANNWLSLVQSSSIAPSYLSVYANPSGLSAGTYSGTITLTGAGVTQIIYATLTVGGTGTGYLTVSPTSLSFSASIGGSIQGPQSVSVYSSLGSTSYSAVASSTNNWLSVIPSSTITPATLGVYANPYGLSSGTYSGTITVTGGGVTQIVYATLTVGSTGTGYLTASPTSLTFSAALGGTIQGPQTVSVSSSLGTTSYTAAASSTNNWLSIVQSSTVTPATLSVYANPSGLSAGTYSGTITLTGAGVTQIVYATLNVGSTATGYLTASPTSLTFTAAVGGSTQGPQTVSVTSSLGSTTYTAVASSTNNWLSVVQSSTVTPATLSVYASPASLSAGTYSGTITLTGGGVTQVVYVTLTVGGTSTSYLTASPASLSFTAAVGGSAPPVQQVTVYSSLGTAIQFSASASMTSGQTWLSVSPTVATTTGTLTVTVVPTGLTTGTYTGSILLTSSYGTTTIPVTFQVGTSSSTGPSGLTLSATSLSFTGEASGAIVGPQTLNISSATSGLAFTTTVTTTTGANWLSVTPAGGGVTPIGLSVYANPASLTLGTYYGTITLTTSSGQSVVQVTFTVSGGTTGAFSVSPSSLTFTAATGSTTSLTQILSITSTSGGTMTYSAYASGGTWLQVTPTSGYTPASLTVIAYPSGLTTGYYSGSIVVQSGTSTQTIPVTLNVGVSGGQALTVSPTSLTFSTASSSTQPTAQYLYISTTSGGATTVTVTISGASWLMVDATSVAAPYYLTVGANSAGMSAGTYTGYLLISGGGSTLNVPVTLTIGSGTGTQVLSVSPASLTFSAPAGAAATSQVLTVASLYGSALTFSATVASGGTWLSVTPISATTPASLIVSANAAALTTGTYSGSIYLTASGVTQTVPVTFNVGTTSAVSVTPTSLTFSATAGGSAPPAQTLSVISTTGVTTAFTVTTSGGTWLTATPASGSTPGSLSVSVNPASLTAGTATGQILILPSGSTVPFTIPVTVTVAQGTTLIANPTSLTFTAKAGDTSVPAQTLSLSTPSIVFTSVAISYTVSTTGGAWLSVTPTGGTTPSSVQVVVNPTGLAAGEHKGTVVITSPGASNSPLSVPVTLTVSFVGPVITSVANSASMATGSASAGTLVSIFGSAMGPETGVQPQIGSSMTVPAELGGVKVYFDGIAAPLLYVQARQINAIVPYQLDGKTSVSVQVEYQGVKSVQTQLQLYDASPGIFTTSGTGQGQAAVLNQDGTVNSTQNPAEPGSIVTFFATGAGQTGPAGKDGLILTSLPLPVPLLPVWVSIGDLNSTVEYAGAAPQMVSGVLQVNARIPATARSGARSLLLQLGRYSSQVGVTIAVK